MVYGINVGQGCFDWPAVKPAGMTVEFRERGEVNYVKSHWSVSEVLIATLMAYERGRHEWAARYFSRAKAVNDKKLSLRPHGYPLHLLFTDRVFTYQPHTMRKDNYHYLRALMHCLRSSTACWRKPEGLRGQPAHQAVAIVPEFDPGNARPLA